MFEQIIFQYDIHVLCVTEHWMVNDELQQQKISNFDLAAYYCRTTIKHGGVAIYTRFRRSQYKVRHDISYLSVELHCELACIELVEVNIVVVTVYRSTNGNIDIFFDVMEQLLCKLNSSGLNIDSVICGDFNLHFLSNDKRAEHLVDLCLMHGVKMTILSPTRGSNCLDNIFTSLQGDCISTVVCTHIGDHDGQLLTTPIQVRPINKGPDLDNNKTTVLKINEHNIRTFKYYLNKETWNDVLKSDNVNNCFLEFLNILNFYISISFVTKNNRPKNNSRPIIKKPVWFGEELHRLKNRLDFLYHLANSDCKYKEMYKNNKKIYKMKVREAKKLSIASYIGNSSNKTKALWSIVNNNNNNGKSKALGNVDSSLSPNDFNKFYVNIASDFLVPNNNVVNINKSSFNDFILNKILPDNLNNFNFTPITENYLLKIISQLKSKRSADYYGMSNYLVKETISSYSLPLTVLINMCLYQGIFPDALKVTIVHPIFKKGRKDQPGNYRPIAIIPVLSKIVEIIMAKQLISFLEENNLLSKGQFGFRSGLSTTHALVKLADDLLCSFENKELAAVTFCDFSRAFDLVSHDILIDKLRYYHVTETALKLFTSYLTNRCQYVTRNNVLSDKLPVTRGVPQGSVLGPLLFLVMINDLDVNIPAKVILYADDTTIITKNKCRSQVLAEAKDHQIIVQNWLAANELVLNAEKTSTCIFGLRESIGDAVFPKFLGLTLDPKLNWHQHIGNLKKKLCSGIFALRRICGVLDTACIKQAYYGLFQSHLSYGLVVWGSSPHADGAFILQKKAIRIIAGAPFREHCRPLFQNLKLLTLPSLYILQCITYILNNPERVSMRSAIHAYGTRGSHKIDLPQLRLHKSESGLLCMASRFLNKLPLSLKQNKKQHILDRLESFLLHKAFYHFQEFLNGKWKTEDFN